MLYLVSDDSMNRDVTRFGDDDICRKISGKRY